MLRGVVGTHLSTLALQSDDLAHVLPRKFQAYACAEAISFLDDHYSEMLQSPCKGGGVCL